MDLLCIGEAMAELRRDGSGFAVGFAGDTFNVAVYARRLLGPGSTGYLTRIGQDPLSDGFARLAAAEGLEGDGLLRDPQANIGIYAVQTDAAGERSFHYWRSSAAARGLFRDPGDLDRLAGAAVLYLSGITLAIIDAPARAALLDRLAALRASGKVRVAFDSNYRPRLWESADTARHWITAAWLQTDIALPSVDDERALFGDPDDLAVLARLQDYGCRFGALKRGAEGPLPIGANLPPVHYHRATTTVDSTAAGDSFNGGFLAATLLGHPLPAALRWGHETARAVVGHPGAIVPAPDLATLERGAAET